MRLRRHRRLSPGDLRSAERFEALLASSSSLSSDEELTMLAEVAQQLAPAVHPREAWRSTLKDRVLREHSGAAVPSRANAGSADGYGMPSLHSVEVVTAALGRVVLADVEPIDEQRAAEITRQLAAVVAVPVDPR